MFFFLVTLVTGHAANCYSSRPLYIVRLYYLVLKILKKAKEDYRFNISCVFNPGCYCY